jgi:hypothetical protein
MCMARSSPRSSPEPDLGTVSLRRCGLSAFSPRPCCPTDRWLLGYAIVMARTGGAPPSLTGWSQDPSDSDLGASSTERSGVLQSGKVNPPVFPSPRTIPRSKPKRAPVTLEIANTWDTRFPGVPDGTHFAGTPAVPGRIRPPRRDRSSPGAPIPLESDAPARVPFTGEAGAKRWQIVRM